MKHTQLCCNKCLVYILQYLYSNDTGNLLSGFLFLWLFLGDIKWYIKHEDRYILISLSPLLQFLFLKIVFIEYYKVSSSISSCL